MRLIFSVDAGETSGVALMRYSTIYHPLETVLTAEVYGYDAEALMALFAGAIAMTGKQNLKLELLLESQPYAPSTQQVNELNRMLLLGASAKEVPSRMYAPSEWKPIVKTLDVQPPKQVRSRHAKDAWLMGYHHIRSTTA